MYKTQYKTRKDKEFVKYNLCCRDAEWEHFKSLAYTAGLELSPFIIRIISSMDGTPPDYERPSEGGTEHAHTLICYKEDLRLLTDKADACGLNRSRYIRRCLYTLK